MRQGDTQHCDDSAWSDSMLSESGDAPLIVCCLMLPVACGGRLLIAVVAAADGGMLLLHYNGFPRGLTYNLTIPCMPLLMWHKELLHGSRQGRGVATEPHLHSQRCGCRCCCLLRLLAGAA